MDPNDFFGGLVGDGAVSVDPAGHIATDAQASDNDLALAAQAGDAQAFMTLVHRHRQKAYWIARDMIGRHEEARDIAQEAFIRVYRALGRFNPKKRFYAWLYQIVVNLSIDHLRRRNYAEGLTLDAVPEMPDHAAGPETLTQRAEQRQAVAQILELLPAKYKAVLILRDIEGFDGREVAKIVGCTHGTVRWRLSKARQMFKDAWVARYGADERGTL